MGNILGLEFIYGMAAICQSWTFRILPMDYVELAPICCSDDCSYNSGNLYDPMWEEREIKKRWKKVRKNREEKSSRVEGDLLTYFILHNLVSVFFFFLFTVYLGIYIGKERLIGFIFQKEFWETAILQVFPICIISSFIGRIAAYCIINGYYNYRNRKRDIQKTTKKWSELNTGINRLGLAFFIAALITSVIYSLGLVGILQFTVFNEQTLLTLIIVYGGVKIGTYFFVQWLVGAKL